MIITFARDANELKRKNLFGPQNLNPLFIKVERNSGLTLSKAKIILRVSSLANMPELHNILITSKILGLLIPLENGYVWLKLVVVVNKANKATPLYNFLNNIRIIITIIIIIVTIIIITIAIIIITMIIITIIHRVSSTANSGVKAAVLPEIELVW